MKFTTFYGNSQLPHSASSDHYEGEILLHALVDFLSILSGGLALKVLSCFCNLQKAFASA